MAKQNEMKWRDIYKFQLNAETIEIKIFRLIEKRVFRCDSVGDSHAPRPLSRFFFPDAILHDISSVVAPRDRKSIDWRERRNGCTETCTDTAFYYTHKEEPNLFAGKQLSMVKAIKQWRMSF